MGLNRRLVPYLLLSALVLGTGLGAGLGLSEVPLTYTANQAPAVDVICFSSTHSPQEKIVTCSSPVTLAGAGHWPAAGFATSVEFHSTTKFPAGFNSCLSKALETIWPVGNSASSVPRWATRRAALNAVEPRLSRCVRPTGDRH